MHGVPKSVIQRLTFFGKVLEENELVVKLLVLKTRNHMPPNHLIGKIKPGDSWELTISREVYEALVCMPGAMII